MNSELPKQFLNIAGKPMLMHTLEKFRKYSDSVEIILVLPEPFFDFWKSMIKRYNFRLQHYLQKGGKERFFSVKNGLKLVGNDSVVAIHDGVRPLVDISTIKNVFKVASEKGNAIPAISVNQSMRMVNGLENRPVNRDNFRLIQTPQGFRSEIIIKAYEQKYQENFTDDATVVEAMGEKINLVRGNIENIKITRLSDLKIAGALLK
ncbi:MAG: 2-C-methyl-D-erythritol 4-phosphate cytidylyltransferase [Bacteroidales bacterium]|nr:2-C-methyl-D-erythritol 4-phosphate cytidylyltransferase [Bacteroidales bacterium]